MFKLEKALKVPCNSRATEPFLLFYGKDEIYGVHAEKKLAGS